MNAYQTSPVLVVLQNLLYGVPLPHKLKLALIPITLGVIMATTADIEMNATGTFFAVCGVLSTSFYQLWVKTKQQDLELSSFQMLYLQAPPAAVVVFLVSLCMEPSSGPG